MVLSLTAAFTRCALILAWVQGVLLVPLALILQESSSKSSIYNILWALVFGFATLNILGLVAKRFEPERNRFSFGEMLAVMVVVVAILLLGWEMLYVFGVLPIKLEPHY
ncbi:MAG: hypothetical protein JST79_22030 [Acidobacteria bacterium]|jgi:hypothetical protein|nr:hypothetical protein [Acidobacteriota bacterium]